MNSKYFFEQFREEIVDEHKQFETHLEQKELPSNKCDHKGKVKAVPGGLMCACGSGWQGSNLDILFRALS